MCLHPQRPCTRSNLSCGLYFNLLKVKSHCLSRGHEPKHIGQSQSRLRRSSLHLMPSSESRPEHWIKTMTTLGCIHGSIYFNTDTGMSVKEQQSRRKDARDGGRRGGPAWRPSAPRRSRARIGASGWTDSPCTVSPAAALRLNGLSGIRVPLIRAQWLCIVLELCESESELCGGKLWNVPRVWSRRPNVACDGSELLFSS